MGRMTSLFTFCKAPRTFMIPRFKRIQLYATVLLVSSIVYLFGVYSSSTRGASYSYVRGVLYIVDKVDDGDLQHPAVASLRDPPDEVAPRLPLTEPRDFFRRLQQPTAHCRKLVNIGGQGCLRRYEGNKDVCLDPEVIPPMRTCLAYSFGVADDITFEDSLGNLRDCTIHLYDPTIVQHGWFMEPPNPKRVFHSEALATHHAEGSSAASSHTVLQPLDALLEKNGHRHSTLHYLKLDIEGGEWEVLRHLVENGLLDNVVQLALELHSTDLRSMARDTWLTVLQGRDDVLHSLEEAGFRRVRVVDNEHFLCRVDLRSPQDRSVEEDTKTARGRSSDGVTSRRSENHLARGDYSTQIQNVGNEVNFAAESGNKKVKTIPFKMDKSGSQMQVDENSDVKVHSTHSSSAIGNPKQSEEIIEQMNRTIKHGNVKNQTVFFTINDGGSTMGNIEGQNIVYPANTVGGLGGNVKSSTIQPSSLHQGDAKQVVPSDNISRLSSLLKNVPSGVAIEAGEVFETEEEYLEFEKHFQQVCQEVLYVRVHKPIKRKER